MNNKKEVNQENSLSCHWRISYLEILLEKEWGWGRREAGIGQITYQFGQIPL